MTWWNDFNVWLEWVSINHFEWFSWLSLVGLIVFPIVMYGIAVGNNKLKVWSDRFAERWNYKDKSLYKGFKDDYIGK